MVCINSPYALRVTTSQGGRHIHAGSLPHFSCALTSLSLPRFSTVYRHVRDLLIQFEVPVDYRGTGINDSPWYILVFR